MLLATDTVSIIGAITSLGVLLVGTGVVGLWRATKERERRAGARDDKLDRAADAVLGTDERSGLVTDVAELKQLYVVLQREVTPNGGRSKRLGDTVRRVENAVSLLGEQLNTHIRAELDARTDLRRELERKADKP